MASAIIFCYRFYNLGQKKALWFIMHPINTEPAWEVLIAASLFWPAQDMGGALN